MVKSLLQTLRTQGANDTTINTIVMLLAVFLFIVGLACVAVLTIDAIRNIAFQPAIVSILSILIAAAAGLVTVSHTTNQINGTAAQSAQAAGNATTNNAQVTAAMVQQVIAASLGAQQQADKHALETLEKTTQVAAPAVSPELIENTEATKENTIATLGVVSAIPQIPERVQRHG